MNFLEIYFNGVLKQSLPIKSDVTSISIGRSSNSDVVINNMGVSNLHAIISKKDNVFYIEDLNSTNGTFLNSQKISSKQKMDPKDSIIIGKHTLKFSEWSQSQEAAPTVSTMETNDATVMLSRTKAPETSQPTSIDLQQNQFYLLVKGKLAGNKKLLLTKNSYGIGKAKDNDIRVGGWFTPKYIAEIEKIGHSFYISPFKKNKVKLNDKIINSSTLLRPTDEIRIKKLFLKFFNG